MPKAEAGSTYAAAPCQPDYKKWAYNAPIRNPEKGEKHKKGKRGISALCKCSSGLTKDPATQGSYHATLMIF